MSSDPPVDPCFSVPHTAHHPQHPLHPRWSRAHRHQRLLYLCQCVLSAPRLQKQRTQVAQDAYKQHAVTTYQGRGSPEGNVRNDLGASRRGQQACVVSGIALNAHKQCIVIIQQGRGCPGCSGMIWGQTGGATRMRLSHHQSADHQTAVPLGGRGRHRNIGVAGRQHACTVAALAEAVHACMHAP